MTTAPARSIHAPVDSREGLGTREFYRSYVNKKPVVMRGALRHLAAVSRWSIGYLASLAPDLRVRLKTGNLANGNTTTSTLREYSALAAGVSALAAAGQAAAEPPPYLHDLPLLSLIPELRADLDPFPVQLFPRFFRPQWWEFTQFFVSPPGGRTPFHFDTLKTHNLFFQIHGQKRFVLVPPQDQRYCYTYNWRWAKVDPDNPDLDAYPLFRHASVFECVLNSGDLLYMPPGTLHQVVNLSEAISFNIDWHDKVSAVRGMLAVTSGMPARNVGYNAAFAAGVLTGMPFRWLKPALGSYFYYIS